MQVTMTEPSIKRTELTRGWRALLTAFFGIMTGVVALPFYIIGPLTKPLEAEFGWDRISIVSATAFLQLGLVIGMPIAGRLAVRIGGRSIALFSFVVMIAIMVSLALWVRSVAMLHLGYFALGLVCAGSSPVTFTMLIGKWFDRARGIALGIALAGTGLSSFLAPLVIEAVASSSGWRMAMLAVTGISALGLPFILFGYREPTVAAPDPASPAIAPRSLATWRELVAEPRFLLLALILLLGGFFISGMVIHLVPMLIEQGMSPGAAARIASLNGLALIVGRLFMGWLLDRLPAVWLGAAMFVTAGLGCMAFVVGGPDFAPVMVVAMGMMIGAEIDLLAYLILRYFRLVDYGLIYGYLYGVYMIGSIASPWVTGYFLELGGYDAMFGSAAAMFGVIAILFPLLDRLRPATAGRGAIAV